MRIDHVWWRNMFAIGFVVTLAACAAGDVRFAEEPAGFWYGLWHGFIAPIAFVVGLFNDGVEIYERANGGGWYDFGFLLGISCFGGCGHRSHRWWRNGKKARDSAPFPHPTRVKVDIDWGGKEDAPASSPTPAPKPTE
jgi:hypothetical protein